MTLRTPWRRCTLIACCCAATLAAPVLAQAPLPSDAERRETARTQGQTVLAHLRNGHVEQALAALGSAADLQLPMDFHHDDGLSAAAGGLHRALAQRSSDERYQLWHDWSLPGDSPNRVRTLTTLVPTDAPPPEFARALGERPRPASFPVATVGAVPGLFSSVWLLVSAAEESGRLRRLIAELEPLAARNVPSAAWVLTLAQLVEARGDMAQLANRLTERLPPLQSAIVASGAGPKSFDPADLVLAAAAMRHEPLRPMSVAILDLLVQGSYGQPAARLRPFLRQTQATALALARGGSDATLPSSALKYWIPVGSGAAAGREGTIEATWLTHEDHILHLSGSDHDLLLFRYPLAGDFEFRCETQDGGRMETDGGLVFGGQSFQVLGSRTEFSKWDVGGKQFARRPCPFVKYANRPTFNQLSIVASQGQAAFVVNRHPMASEPIDGHPCPWLGLRSFGDRRPLFRNLELAGQPIIPREVRLIAGDGLRGWQSRFFSERQWQRDVTVSGDWQLDGGLLRAGEPSTTSDEHAPRWLRYQRPLLPGESVSYEFLDDADAAQIHPAFGRLAFLLSSEGIRIRWITAGGGEWSTLASDNALTEPLNRRGPRPLPLQPRDWNRITLSRTDKAVTLALNGTVIYQRPVDWRGDERFGFYCEGRQTSVPIRNVVLTGDWPETLPTDFLDNPAVTVGEPPSLAVRHAIHELIGDEFLAENVKQFRRQMAALPAAERFQRLSAWVLPGPVHAGFRLAGEFTQTDPSPLALQLDNLTSGAGGELVSPVFDWLDAAKELGQLPAVRDQILAVPEPATRDQQRAREALLTLVHLEVGDHEAASAACMKLHALVKATTAAGVEDQWPEVLVIWRGMHRFPGNAAVADLLALVYSQRTLQWRPAGIYGWHNQIGSVAGLLRQRELAANNPEAKRSDPPSDWIPASAARASTRGNGHPVVRWEWTGPRGVKYAGHNDDFLFYRYPLAGDFEVECELTEPSHTPAQILLGGTYVGPRWNRKELEMGSARGGGNVPLEPPLSTFGPWVRYRGVVLNGECRVFLNGRQVHAFPLPQTPDPWVAVRVWGRFHGGVQNVRILGNPAVLGAVPLSASEDLTGWYAYYPQDGVAQAGARWLYTKDPESTGGIIGRADLGLAGTHSESLLQYQRPLVDGEWVEYEFFYAPGQSETHPALDRLTFILDPHGVREHWITDDRFDPSDVPPHNVADVPEHRRGPAELPLQHDAWNRLKLSVRNRTALLELNGQLVYQRPLEANHQRTIGLFHYIDRTEVRVRNMLLRGDWPKSLPPVAEQQLAGTASERLDADRPRLKAVFEHEFTNGGLPQQYFKPLALTGNARVSVSPQGLQVERPSTSTWQAVDIVPKFALHGDFDIEASFEDLHLQSDKDADVRLIAVLSGENNVHCRVHRIRTSNGKQEMRSSLAVLQRDGSRAYPSHSTAGEAVSGRLRIARRGDRVHFLFAEGDSPTYHTIATETLSAADVERGGVRLESSCNGQGTSNVIWTGVVLRAERMTWFPEEDNRGPRHLLAMRPDGTDLHVVATPAAAGYAVVGSPEWSSDGRQIAMDMSQGSTATSHIIVVDADGSNLKDLGPGCMPSFSADRKKLVFSDIRSGITLMNADGTRREVLDPAGWGTQWSPDGKKICWGKGGNITIRDVATGQDRQLLVGDAASRYGYIYWNLGWSHDSRSVGFKARRRDNNADEIAVADVDAPRSFKVLVAGGSGFGGDITWTPDNSAIVFSMPHPASQGNQLFKVDRQTAGPPQLLPGQPADYKLLDGDWSHDGKWIVSAAQAMPRPVDWTGRGTEATP